MLVRRLQGNDGEFIFGDQPRLAHHIAFVRTVTVYRDEQRQGCVGVIFGKLEVVIKFDLGRDAQVGLQEFGAHQSKI